mmetsp:Transcript_42375/g.88992  ORF Transcript_42375/g.88992 Transcript_42375/m.88992 type:complete len:93 (-) Transcript_42375:17-295(-)
MKPIFKSIALIRIYVDPITFLARIIALTTFRVPALCGSLVDLDQILNTEMVGPKQNVSMFDNWWQLVGSQVLSLSSLEVEVFNKRMKLSVGS